MPIFFGQRCAIRAADFFCRKLLGFLVDFVLQRFPAYGLPDGGFRQVSGPPFMLNQYNSLSRLSTSFGKESLGGLAWLMPVVATWCIVVAHVVFYAGLRRYDSPRELIITTIGLRPRKTRQHRARFFVIHYELWLYRSN